jgi:hypothetical protein
MTNKEVMNLMTSLNLHEGGMDNWIADNAWVKFAHLVAAAEREACFGAMMQSTAKAVDTAMALEREASVSVCEAIARKYQQQNYASAETIADECASAIMARSQA